jgi:hypothetical protein
MFWKILFYIFLAYMLYNLVFKFILPVYRTTRRVKKGFREMQDRMNEQMRQQQGYGGSTSSKPHIKPETNSTATGEYIDFEEVKD